MDLPSTTDTTFLRCFFLLLLLRAAEPAPEKAGAMLEVREAVGCSWSHVRLWCPEAKAKIGMLDAGLLQTGDSGPGPGPCTVPFLPPSSPLPPLPNSSSSSLLPFPQEITRDHIRQPLNYRCSGRNSCNFNLKEDYPQSQDWAPGTLLVRYVCIAERQLVHFCNVEVSAGEGFLSNPTYPHYYQGQKECVWSIRAAQAQQRIAITLLDMSIRGVSWGESECVDALEVREGRKVLLHTCGEHPGAALVLTSQADTLTVSLLAKTTFFFFPKRGVLIHYKAVGCATPAAPHEGYLVQRNDTHAHFMCCVDHLFPDTRMRTRTLHCRNQNAWDKSLPDCMHVSSLGNESVPPELDWWAHANGSSSGPVALLTPAASSEVQLAADIVLPSVIIVLLLLGNAVILVVIYHLRSKTLSTPSGEDVVAMQQNHRHHNNNGSTPAV